MDMMQNREKLCWGDVSLGTGATSCPCLGPGVSPGNLPVRKAEVLIREMETAN